MAPSWIQCTLVAVLLISSSCVVASKFSPFLSKNILPFHYNLELRPDIYTDEPSKFSIRATTDVFVDCKAKINEVRLHSLNLTINWKTFFIKNLKKPDALEIGKVTYNSDYQFWTVELPKAGLLKDHRYHIHIESTASLKINVSVGMYVDEYHIGDEIRYFVSIQAQPTFSRMIYPCFDEPAMKATFSVWVHRKGSHRALSNMPLFETVRSEDGWLIDKFIQTPKMSTYALSVFVSDFVHRTMKTGLGVEINMWVRASIIDSPVAKDALEAVAKFLDKSSSYLQVAYPLSKLDVIGLPNFYCQGGMDKWGVITYSESSLFNAKRGSSVLLEEMNQWFGNLVAVSWWNDTWLSEALAGFTGDTAVFTLDEAKQPPARLENFLDLLELDSYKTSFPVSTMARSPTQILGMFRKLSYVKGHEVLRMLHFVLGYDEFRKGIENYLKTHKYGVAGLQDFSAAMNKAIGSDVSRKFDTTKFLEPWLRQNNLPMVTLTINGKSLKINQRRFLKPGQKVSQAADFTFSEYFDLKDDLYNSTAFHQFGYKWDIPLALMISDTAHSLTTKADIIWMRESSLTLNTVNGVPLHDRMWILANPRLRGTYRVNYGNILWKRLIDQLIIDYKVIPAVNRRVIVHDVFEYSGLGMVPSCIALRIGKYVTQTVDVYEWKFFLNEASFYGNLLTSSKSKLVPMFKKYMYDTVKSVVKEVENVSSPLFSLSDQFCRFVDPFTQCRSRLYENKSIVAYLTEKIKSKNNDPKIVKELIARVVNDGYASDALALYLANQLFFRKLRLTLDDHCPRTKNPTKSLEDIVYTIAKALASDEDIKKLDDHLHSHPLTGRITRKIIENSKKIIEKNKKWVKEESSCLEKFFKKYT